MSPSPANRPPIHTIDGDELRTKLARGDAFKLVMTLNEWTFRAKHIPGSLHFNTPPEMLAALRPDDEIVVYCSNVDCLASKVAYYRLLEAGYTNVRRYAGGLIDWEERHLPLEGDWVDSSTSPAKATGKSSLPANE